MKKYIVILASLIVVTLACNTNPRSSIINTGNFGATVKTDSLMTVSELLNMVQTKNNSNVNVTGKIEKYCKGEGCWLTLQNPSGGKALFIEVENKAFVLPLDIEGKTATVSGKVNIDSSESEPQIKIVSNAISIQ